MEKGKDEEEERKKDGERDKVLCSMHNLPSFGRTLSSTFAQ
jgi:hypothetical protein